MFQPQTLDDVIGQRHVVQRLKMLVDQPRRCCLLLEGEPGIGKSATARAFANDLGCEDEFAGKWYVPCAEFGIDDAKAMFNHTLRLRYNNAKGFSCLILEEAEWMSPQLQRFLKTALDPVGHVFPRNLIVVATSNGAGKLDKALLERFHLFSFSCGPAFAESCQERLRELWEEQTGGLPPPEMSDWGFDGDRFSMRQALQRLETELLFAPV